MFVEGVTGIVNEPFPVPVAVAPLFSVIIQAPDALTFPVISVDAPAQTEVLTELIVAVGFAVTSTGGVVFEQPGAAVLVNVNVTDPGAIPVTTAPLTLAIEELLLSQVPPVFGVKLKVLPTQTEDADVTDGNAITLTVRFTVRTHPFALVTV